MIKTQQFCPNRLCWILFILVFSACVIKPETRETVDSSELAEVYTGLRSTIISTDPHDIGIEQNELVPNIWGVLMEFQIEGTPITLASLADGTTSLYLGNGGAFIGAGEHEQAAIVSMELIALAETYLSKMVPNSDLKFQAEDDVNFHFLTFDGSYTIIINEEDLINGGHDFSPLFYKADDVITQIRLISSDN